MQSDKCNEETYYNNSIVENMRAKTIKKNPKVYEDDEDANLGYYDPAKDGQDDRGYQKLLPSTEPAKKKKNNDFFLTSEKYAGKKAHEILDYSE